MRKGRGAEAKLDKAFECCVQTADGTFRDGSLHKELRMAIEDTQFTRATTAKLGQLGVAEEHLRGVLFV